MKRFSLITSVVMLVCVMLTGADFIIGDPTKSPSVPKQCGYTIIEAGKALNCHGDTITIERIHPGIIALN
jgi:hypothetical protein